MTNTLQSCRKALRNEFFVLQLLVVDQTSNRVSEYPWALAVVETPFKFFQIGLQMLGPDLVISANDGAVEQAPDVCNRVGMNIASPPIFGAVIYSLMPSELPATRRIERPRAGFSSGRPAPGSGSVCRGQEVVRRALGGVSRWRGVPSFGKVNEMKRQMGVEAAQSGAASETSR